MPEHVERGTKRDERAGVGEGEVDGEGGILLAEALARLARVRTASNQPAQGEADHADEQRGGRDRRHQAVYPGGILANELRGLGGRQEYLDGLTEIYQLRRLGKPFENELNKLICDALGVVI